ncbi:MAG: VOC family protein [Acidiferrobacteraceae bacterium]
MASVPLPLFHLAFPVDDLAGARTFYTGILGCREGRSAETWVDFDLYGHQIVAHLYPAGHKVEMLNRVDDENVPIPHFGVILSMEDWHSLVERLRLADVPFLREPRTRFLGRPGEQATLFLLDPSGNALEFKAFASPDCVFAR